MRHQWLLGAAACAAMFLFLASGPASEADVIGQTVAPGAQVVGTVVGLEYDASGQLVVAIVKDRRGRRFLVFDGETDNDLQKYGAALALAFGARSRVTLTVSDGDVTGVTVHRGRRVATGELLGR